METVVPRYQFTIPTAKTEVLPVAERPSVIVEQAAGSFINVNVLTLIVFILGIFIGRWSKRNTLYRH